MYLAAAVDPTQIGTQVAVGTGGQVLDFAVGVAPVAVPFVLGLIAVRWGLSKFGLAGRVGFTGVDLAPRQHSYRGRPESGYDEAMNDAAGHRRLARKYDRLADDTSRRGAGSL